MSLTNIPPIKIMEPVDKKECPIPKPWSNPNGTAIPSSKKNLDYKRQFEDIVSFYKEHRKGTYDLVKNHIIDNIYIKNKKFMIVHAPVKSGKRGFVQLARSITMAEPKYEKYRGHFFVTSLVRKADEGQMKEMHLYGISTNPIFTTKGGVGKANPNINNSLFHMLNRLYDNNSAVSIIDYMKTMKKDDPNKYSTMIEYAKGITEDLIQGEQNDYEENFPIVHIDESDYGTNSDGMMSVLWKYIASDKFKGYVVLYSATPYETIAGIKPDANQGDLELYKSNLIVFEPAKGYCGAETFLANGLVHKAEPFFTSPIGTRVVSLSDQGKKIIQGAKECIKNYPERNIIILRITTKGNLEKTAKDNYHVACHSRTIGGIDNETVEIFFHSDTTKTDGKGKNSIQSTGAETKQIVWDERGELKGDIWQTVDEAFPINKGKVFILVIDQICARSTEIKFHDRIYAYHDCRDFDKVAVSTMTQAQERVAHYAQNYNGYFQPIHIYGDPESMKISAGGETLIKTMKILSHRIKAPPGKKRTIRGVSEFLEYTGEHPMTKDSYESFIKEKLKGDFFCVDGECIFTEITQKKIINSTVSYINYQDEDGITLENGSQKIQHYYLKLDGIGKAKFYTYDELAKRGWGIGNSASSVTVRVQPCYKDNKYDSFGVMIIWCHEEYEEKIIYNVKTKSVYKEDPKFFNKHHSEIMTRYPSDAPGLDITDKSMYKLLGISN